MDGQRTTHEDYRRVHAVERGSNRSVGILFAVVFAAVGCWPAISGAPLQMLPLAIGGAFLATAMAAPRLLAPIAWIWFGLGRVLHHIVNPIILGIIYFGAILPTGLLMKLFAGDPLRRQWDDSKESYWIEREPPGPDPDSLQNQF